MGWIRRPYLLSMRRVELLVSPTDDMGKILNALHNIPIGGACHFTNAIQVAQLALKHRREKKGAQRVIVFVASPIADEDKALTKMGKLLKKNNVAIDIVSFGDIDVNESKLKLLIEAANSNNNSNYVTIPQGALPSDVLVSSPIIHGGEGGGGMGGGAAGAAVTGFAEFGGIDPSMDPELALALKVSMEEERARQEAAQKASQESTSDPKDTTATQEETPMATDIDGDEELQRALQLSMQEAAGGSSSSTENTESTAESKEAPPPAPSAAAGSSAAFLDPTFVNNLLSGLPGVDPNDPKIKAAMAQLNKKDEDKKDGDDKKKE